MAKRLSLGKKQLLVSIHVIAVAAWFGGTVGMLLLGLYLKNAADGEQLYYTLLSMHVIDENLLKYPALLTLITGIMLSVWTQWGLVKHYWVVIKLVLTITIIMLGILFLNNWLSYLEELAVKFGFVALQNQDFQSTWLSIRIMSSFNLLCLIVMVFITYFKPFGKIKK
ncbi:hypothetical protein I6N90_24250 [Paenibacillus sp. GSMTC-2017]|uniref:hypothetical protein n=1 Tax=Paenibacillus sp. GSMTC-2017 TaxID=2794350 RepID=UPI0018D9E64E|nr:hypothetical protein [Paenibacillus sp. GSMTC-2017]MBH5320903.1 hypothetical protein [Paenibacillus sp. GSMTC-2017]